MNRPLIVHGNWAQRSFLQCQFAMRAAKENDVIFVDLPTSLWKKPWKIPLGRRVFSENGRLKRYSPLVLPRRTPFVSEGRIDRMNTMVWAMELARLCGAAKNEKPIVFYDTPYQERFVHRLNEALSVYLCIDNRTCDILGNPNPKDVEDEQKLCLKVDLIFAISEGVKEKLRPFNKNIHVIPNGYDETLFRPNTQTPKHQDLVGIPHPRLGCIGFISGRLDVAGLLETVKEKPEWSFVLMGEKSPHLMDELRKLGNWESWNELVHCPNFYLLGAKPFHEMPACIQALDVCLVPYKLSPFTLMSSPVKAYEYLAMGKPVVSTRIPDLEKFGDVLYFADEGQSYADAIEAALKEDASLQQKRLDVMKDHSIGKRFEQIKTVLKDWLK